MSGAQFGTRDCNCFAALFVCLVLRPVWGRRESNYTDINLNLLRVQPFLNKELHFAFAANVFEKLSRIYLLSNYSVC